MKEVRKFTPTISQPPTSQWTFKRKNCCYPVPIEVINFKFNLDLIITNENHRDVGHKYFDLIWKSELMTRTDAYKWLAKQLGINKRKCHFKMFDETMTIKSILICLDYLSRNEVHF
jgi:hypothetical protein